MLSFGRAIIERLFYDSAVESQFSHRKIELKVMNFCDILHARAGKFKDEWSVTQLLQVFALNKYYVQSTAISFGGRHKEMRGNF